MSYNGWSNHETWLVNVWYNPESKEDVQYAKDTLEEQYDSIPDGPLKNMINLRAINWKELESHFEDNDEDDDADIDEGETVINKAWAAIEALLNAEDLRLIGCIKVEG